MNFTASEKQTKNIWSKGFQDYLFAACLQEPNMIATYRDVLSPEMFENQKSGKLFRWVLEYYDAYRKPPTKSVLKDLVHSKANRNDVQEDYVRIINKVYALELDGVVSNYVQDKTSAAAKSFAIKRALLKSVNFLYEGRYDDIRRALDEAMAVGETQEKNWLFFTKDWQTILLEPAEERRSVNIGYKQLQKATGGVDIGELFTVMAPPNQGKTLVLQNLAGGAWLHGHKVTHFSFELNERKTVLRYLARVTKINYKSLLDQVAEVKKRIGTVSVFSNGDIAIKFLPPKSTSIVGLRSQLLFLKSNDFIPDLVVFDYADLIKPSVIRKEKREELSEIYTDLRSLASELEFAALTASQSRRSSLYKQIIDLNDVAEDWGKMAISDIVAAICQTTEEFNKRLLRIYIPKTRGEMRGKQAYFKVNYDRLWMKEISPERYMDVLSEGVREKYGSEEFETEDNEDSFVRRKRPKGIDEDSLEALG